MVQNGIPGLFCRIEKSHEKVQPIKGNDEDCSSDSQSLMVLFYQSFNNNQKYWFTLNVKNLGHTEKIRHIIFQILLKTE